MNAFGLGDSNYGFTKVSCSFHRIFGERDAYMIMVGIPGIYFKDAWRGMPCASAVMDDFGNLVIVENWL